MCISHNVSHSFSSCIQALWFRELKDQVSGTHVASAEGNNLRESLMRLPICFGMALKTRDKCKQVAERLNGKDHCFVLGKGYGEPVAMEGALKIKEMCYLHAEGKHYQRRLVPCVLFSNLMIYCFFSEIRIQWGCPKARSICAH